MPDVKCPKDMVYIQAGTLRMGSTNGNPNEQPVHDVPVSAFCMDIHEVTNAQYSEYITSVSKFELIATSCQDGSRSVIARGSDSSELARKNKGKLDGEKVCALEVKDVTPQYIRPSGFDGPNQPAGSINWFEADAYCKAQGKRLPTEAEWERGARGPDCKEFDKTFYSHSDRTEDVCSHPANGYGLFDMLGNVWEWVADWFDGDNKILRNGSVRRISLPGVVRTTGRDPHSPDYDRYLIGFRCASDPRGSKK